MAEVGGGEETPLSSPKSKVKFLCSHGGKILPRPPDELMKKLNSLANGDMALKYQVIPEDLDILVSVTCEEDLHHMFNEYDRWDVRSSENGGTPRLRAFLFPSNQILTDNQTVPNNIERLDIEQRYIDAINGNSSNMKRTSSNMSRSNFSFSSNGSSPRSVHHEGYPFDTINQEAFVSNSYHNNCNKEFHRVNSSPTLYNLGNPNHHYHPNHHNPFYQSTKPHNPYKGGGQPLVKQLSVGRSELGKLHQLDHSPIRYYSPSRHQRGRCGCMAYGDVDECNVYKSGSVEIVDGLPQTSMKQTWE
ncbi:Phox/Bem1p [Macleaya cordata]|uniref:Phox/Bem1p n=1 Tax=Macleaya cordata TaxID=56857 RepID=A0A200PZL0_MACCD|nr:Phox/Bem1p [Macleaya cordata]